MSPGHAARGRRTRRGWVCLSGLCADKEGCGCARGEGSVLRVQPRRVLLTRGRELDVVSSVSWVKEQERLLVFKLSLRETESYYFFSGGKRRIKKRGRRHRAHFGCGRFVCFSKRDVLIVFFSINDGVGFYTFKKGGFKKLSTA